MLPRIHQYKIKMIYKPGSDLFIAEWLSRQNHKENRDDEILDLKVNINTIHMTTDIPDCMTTQEIQQTVAKGKPPTTAERIYHKRLARKQK